MIQVMGFCSKKIRIFGDFHASLAEKKSKDGKENIIASKYEIMKAD